MTAALDFAMLPPEINSARMYSGAGPGPLLAAASAWNGLAAELHTAATCYSSILTELTGQAWHGPAATAMAAAAAPYVAWMSATALQAEEAAAQAGAAVAAYEAAFVATVPPMVIAANRAELMALIATNFFGQNTPAIAANEAQYAEMWGQDATAMYGYAGSSAAATRLTPFTQPRQTTSSSGIAAQSAAVSQAAATSAGAGQNTLTDLISAMPNALQGLTVPSSSSSSADMSGILGLLLTGSSGNTALDGFWTQWGPNAQIWNTIFASGFYMPARFLGTAAAFMGLGGQGGGAAAAAEGAAGTAESAAGAASAATGPLGNLGAAGSSVSAGLGKGALIGPLSVPPSWTAPTSMPSPLSSILGSASLEAPPEALAASTPPMPLAGNMGFHGEGRAVPQYGFKPTFVARPPAAG